MGIKMWKSTFNILIVADFPHEQYLTLKKLLPGTFVSNLNKSTQVFSFDLHRLDKLSISVCNGFKIDDTVLNASYIFFQI